MCDSRRFIAETLTNSRGMLISVLPSFTTVMGRRNPYLDCVSTHPPLNPGWK
ncbi:unnamed protein product [Taenia asiatica]|uniref:Uncharacterized protein n=1 Tax=Taenia asiatica TaxID=60517 RepID=A0A0R3W8Z4_TAEAS|nr:unnamed protein product [Taenia asiatica]